jgi:hypothetical protein
MRSTLNDNKALGAKGQNGTTGSSAPGGIGGAGFGGGIYATNATVNIVNSTLHGNQAGGAARGLSGSGAGGASGAGRGGGIYHSGSGVVTLNNATVARNQITDVNGSTAGNGAGLYNSVGVVQVHNSLIALNTFAPAIVGNGRDVNGAFSSQGFNLIGIRTGSTGFIASDKKGTLLAPLDPKLGDLLDNGGFTLTCAIDQTSPAWNSGDLANPLSEDQRGVARLNDRIDIGAFEFIALPAL